ncbi:MAG: exopolysaccharide biosynthesis protein [Aquamicrobium sp.]|uniref:exopolysaccharide biosynthesis protein n=1 Tax=Aquamicrobium sp. TaxID=1872579 RepID=UPI00349E5F00|nr:exopolysaccharide biosynthesis protein [Aquamicrobium sp.]
MDKDCEPESVQDVLECVENAGNGVRRASVADIVDRIGDGAFPPLMLVPALAIISPLSAVFGVATICGLIIATIAPQMALGRESLWLPGFIMRLSISSRNIDRTVRWFGTPAQLIDRLTGKRLTLLVEPPLTRLWAALCLALALVIPFFELVPMSATIIASAIALFTLAMLARDGLLALAGLGVLAGASWLLWSVVT